MFYTFGLSEDTLSFITMIIPLALLFIIFYFLMLRPERKRRQSVMEMQSRIKKDDKIITIGGIHGIIDEMRDDVLTIIIASGARMKIEKAAVKQVLTDEKS